MQIKGRGVVGINKIKIKKKTLKLGVGRGNGGVSHGVSEGGGQ